MRYIWFEINEPVPNKRDNKPLADDRYYLQIVLKYQLIQKHFWTFILTFIDKVEMLKVLCALTINK